MQIIAIDLNDTLAQEQNLLAPFLKHQAVKKGDKLEIFKDETIKGATLVAGMLMIFVALRHTLSDDASPTAESVSDSSPVPGFSNFETSKEIATAIERDLGVSIEVKNKIPVNGNIQKYSKPILKKFDPESVKRQKGFTGHDRAEFMHLIDQMDVQEPVEELLKMLTK